MKTRILILGLSVVLFSFLILLWKRVFVQKEEILLSLPPLPPIVLPSISPPETSADAASKKSPASPATTVPVAPAEEAIVEESPPTSPVAPPRKIEEKVHRPDMQNIPMFTLRKDLIVQSS
jgi:hypothetical protein